MVEGHREPIGQDQVEERDILRHQAALRRATEFVLFPTRVYTQLETLLKREPQRDSSGDHRWLLTSGRAADLGSGRSREHHDIDVVVMQEAELDHWQAIRPRLDLCTPTQYRWGEMSFPARFLARTARVVPLDPHGPRRLVEIVHPAILLVQKMSESFGLPPRDKDWYDALALLHYYVQHKAYEDSQKWSDIVECAIDSVPPENQHKTEAYLRELANRYREIA